jgi:hypothetical protein
MVTADPVEKGVSPPSRWGGDGRPRGLRSLAGARPRRLLHRRPPRRPRRPHLGRHRPRQRDGRFVQGKTKRRIEIPLHPEFRKWLLAVPEARRAVHLFPTQAARKPSGRNGLTRQFGQIMRAAGIEPEVTKPKGGKGRSRSSLSFHSLRHSFNSPPGPTPGWPRGSASASPATPPKPSTTPTPTPSCKPSERRWRRCRGSPGHRLKPGSPLPTATTAPARRSEWPVFAGLPRPHPSSGAWRPSAGRAQVRAPCASANQLASRA